MNHDKRMPRDCFNEPERDHGLISRSAPSPQRSVIDGVQSSCPDPMELESFRKPLDLVSVLEKHSYKNTEDENKDKSNSQSSGCLMIFIAGTSTLAAGVSPGIYELVNYLC
ncbi:hypothetical protein GOV12_01435 [Candidatus Pacearchaeota archaeon]|nr:hypothetical protein [Candidatus Pacearchaeota archaeon]